MRYEQIYKRLLICCLILGAASSALAAQLADLASMPYAKFAAGILVALFGGVTYTLHRVNQERKAGTLEPPMLPGVIADLTASLGSGLITTGFGEWTNTSFWPMLIFLYLSGYAGTRLLEPAASAMVARAVEIINMIKPKG